MAEAAETASLPAKTRPAPSGGRGKTRWTKRKEMFVSGILEGKNGAEAAIAAGYCPSNPGHAKHRAYDLLHNDPWVIAELDKRREAMRRANAITVDSMFQQLDEDRAFAIETSNATAAVRASELKAKLAGLLVERRDTRMVGGFNISIQGLSDG